MTKDMSDNISLSKWISLSTLLERQSINRGVPLARGDHDDTAETKNPQLAYVERAVKAALLLLDCLQNGDASRSDEPSQRDTIIQAEDIDVEKFTAAFLPHVANNNYLGRNGGNNNAHEVVQSIADGTLIGIHFCDSLKHKSIINQDQIMQSDAYFRRIGQLLYQIFCRGEKPPCQLESTAVRNDSEELINGWHKRMHKSDQYSHLQLFDEYNVPVSICRLVSDLMHAGEGVVESPFESLGDIVSELKQISEKPNVYLHSTNTSNPEKLNFGEEVYGRMPEVFSLLQAAATTSMADGTHPNKLVLIGGPSGSGKSFLVKSMKEPWSRCFGFMHISAKFDRLPQQQPLSTMSSALSDFFVTIADGEVDDNAEDILTSMEQDLTPSGIAILSNLIPSIRSLFPHILRRVVSDPDLSALGVAEAQIVEPPNDAMRGNIVRDDEDDEDTTTSNAVSSRNRLHHLFRRLIHAIASPDHPVILFLDDLQWADCSSLDLISSLLLGFDHPEFGGNISQCFLVVGTYRDDEVNDSHTLTPFLEKCDESNSVLVRKINLEGIPRECAHCMISDSLKLPLRLTRALTDVIMSKTSRIPLNMKEFVSCLVDDNILHYSLLEKRWVWDIEHVRAVSMDDDVAELLTRKILKLADNARVALKVASCFGSQINESFLRSLSLSKEWIGLDEGFDVAVIENILEKNGQGFNFVHDKLQEASYELMHEEECHEYHYKIGMQLMSCVRDDSDFSPAVFAVISQINRSKAFGVSEELQVQFSTLNLKAGRRSIEVSDFGSALSYFEHGIAYLPESPWQSYYVLSLGLYESMSLCFYVLAQSDKMKISLTKVFEHAACLEDKLNGYYMLIRTMASVGKLNEATEKVWDILRALGEDFPDDTDITPAFIRNEIISTKDILIDLTKEDILALPQMTDTNKKWTVKYLALFIFILHQPKYVPLVAARVIKISVSYGYASDSAFGFIGFGLSLIKLCNDIDGGHRLGKLSLLLSERPNIEESRPKVMFWYFVLLAYWKEPIQAIVAPLRGIAKESLAVGDNEHAGITAIAHSRLSFMAGDNLREVEQACSSSASMLGQLRQSQLHLLLTVHHNTILQLSIARDQEPFDSFDSINKNEDELFRNAINECDQTMIHTIIMNRIIRSFWFKRYEEAAALAIEYDVSRNIGFRYVMHVFYAGMSALHCARIHPNEPKWMEAAEKNALASYRMWAQHSSWNFEHRLFLLEAEWHFARDETEKAEGKYNAAIESARRHRFVNEEGLANDLFSTFHTANGDVNKARRHITEARACYDKWGARALVHLLDQHL